MKQYDVVEATFSPPRTDDLRHEAEVCVGKRYQWMADWLVEEGPYEGQWAMTPYPLAPMDDRKFAWVPESDLRDVVVRERLDGKVTP